AVGIVGTEVYVAVGSDQRVARDLFVGIPDVAACVWVFVVEGEPPHDAVIGGSVALTGRRRGKLPIGGGVVVIFHTTAWAEELCRPGSCRCLGVLVGELNQEDQGRSRSQGEGANWRGLNL